MLDEIEFLLFVYSTLGPLIITVCAGIVFCLGMRRGRLWAIPAGVILGFLMEAIYVAVFFVSWEHGADETPYLVLAALLGLTGALATWWICRRIEGRRSDESF